LDRNSLGKEEFISEFLLTWLRDDFLPRQEQAVLRNYYASYCKHFSERMRRHYDDQTSELMDLVSALNNPSVLEVGCGCGTESLWVAFRGAEVRAIDVKASRIEVAAKRLEVIRTILNEPLKCVFEKLSLLDLSNRSQYDIIWMEQTLHHLEPRREILDKLVDLLKPGGYIVISEANSLNPLLQIVLFAKRGWKTVKTYKDEFGGEHPYGNERVLSARVLCKSLETRGIETVKIRYFRIFPNHPIFDSAAWLEQSMPRWLVPLFTHFNYVGRKAAI